MVIFSNSKINLGLWVLSKRADGFHNIETIFYPINWRDVIEIIPDTNTKTQGIALYCSGITLSITETDNIIYKAYHLLCLQFDLPYLKVFLHKNVPFGAGLGAGSANAAYFIKACNALFSLGLSNNEMVALCNKLGSDCAFFLDNKPCKGTERGGILTSINVDLSMYYILVVYPNVIIPTKDAYNNTAPMPRDFGIESIVSLPIVKWKDELSNDFEKSIFQNYPNIKQVKDKMYQKEAVYASLSGSGSAVYGIFTEKPPIESNEFKGLKVFLQNPAG